ncbi:MAG: phosphoglucosamine mutase [Gemmatimonadales bacterium]
MPDTLMVGVSGIRGIVGKDLTPEIVARYAAAFGTWTRTGGVRRPRVVLGRDARTSGHMFAQAASAGLESVGCDVIDIGLTTTPSAQLAVEHHHAAGGIILTASHNPIEWNALKFVGPDGVFIDETAGAQVRALAAAGPIQRADHGSLGTVTPDPEALRRHLTAVLRLPGVEATRVRKRHFRVALDTCRGAGGAIMPELLERLGCEVTGINLETDGRFPRSPEPIPENLGALEAEVRRVQADIGFAVDPDVDRLAIVDEQGATIGEDYTLAFAVRAVLGKSPAPTSRKGGTPRAPTLPALVVCNLSTSLVVEDAARDCGAELVRAPVGEAHVARTMIERRAPIGGEGNGGVMYAALHVGRDAPVGAALVLALLAREGRRVSELVAAAPRYAIVKDKVPRGRAGGLGPVYAALRAHFADAAVDERDGLRLGWQDRWLHVRSSNTEPIVRLIAEAPTEPQARELVEVGRTLCAAS